jgi:PAB-dependent poly(A)-specific ribonuclease subunit 3
MALLDETSLTASGPLSTKTAPQEVPEFVPQNFDPNQTTNQTDASLLYDPYTLQTAIQGSQPTITNPYLQEMSAGYGGAFYQQPAFTQPLQYHLYAPQPPYRENLLPYQRTQYDFFISEDIRREFQKRNEATLQVLPNPSLLPHLDHFHSLVPIDTNNQRTSTMFGYPTWIYKAISSKDGKTYAIRRLEGFRLTNELAIRALVPWKRLGNSAIVEIHDVFTTRKFGDSSLLFVTDYHAASTTLSEHHFPATKTGRHGTSERFNSHRQVPEAALWAYIVQMALALKTIHGRGLAARVIHPSKLLLTSKNRIRLNACGILDVVTFPQDQPQLEAKVDEKEDFVQLGRTILCVATGNLSNYDVPPLKLVETLEKQYSRKFTETLKWLVSPAQELAEAKGIDALLVMIAEESVKTLDSTLHATDRIESVLATSLEDGRIARLLLKMNLALERPDHEHNLAWSETGERYYIKLFRDYVFHAVNASGRPITDLSHIIGCLSRLDAGSMETIQLTSRDNETAFIVSYRDIKRSIESAFNELNGVNTSTGSGKGRK